MQLTRQTDYALRLLMFLSLRESDALVTVSEIADSFMVPHNHLLKIVQKLAQHGFIQTVRGKGGGIRFALRPDQIVIGSVVRKMETNLDLIDCADPICPLNYGCELRSVLDEARDAFLSVLDRYTVTDLVNNPARMRSLLNLPARAGNPTAGK